MRGGDAALALGLRAPVVAHGRELVLLHVRLPLPAVEDDVRGQVDESRADTRRGPRDVLGAVDVDRTRRRPVLTVGRVDHDVRSKAAQQRLHGVCVANLDPLARRVGPQPDELGAEIPGGAGDVKPHGCTLSGGRFRLAAMRRTFLWINFVLASLIVLLIFLQAYLIASYAMGAGEGALDAHGSSAACSSTASSCSSS